jgi:hypothetical protein
MSGKNNKSMIDRKGHTFSREKKCWSPYQAPTAPPAPPPSMICVVNMIAAGMPNASQMAEQAKDKQQAISVVPASKPIEESSRQFIGSCLHSERFL